MLHILVDNVGEFFDERTNEFITVKPQTLAMEHSLLSLSKWEAKWHKPFLSDDQKTEEEYLDYIRCMTITPNVNPIIYQCLSNKNFEEIRNYIADPHTATVIKKPRSGKGRAVTSELIYYWMTVCNIPIECEKWHLNRLITLVEIASIENSPKKKMGKNDIYRQNRDLNALRRAKYKTRG